MTLDEAIKDLENSLAVLWKFYPEHRQEAVKLGIEALKRHQSLSDYPDYEVRKWLPGETEE